jgi:flagellar biosynthesis GTPase FlhF
VLARIAAGLAARGRKPVLVCTDGESVAGEDTLEAVAAALDLRFETAFLEGQLAEVVERIGTSEIYLVDTPGCTPAEREGTEGLRSLVDVLPGAEVLAVLPATADLDEIRFLARAYALLGETRVILTKLDELSRPGRLVDLAACLE